MTKTVLHKLALLLCLAPLLTVAAEMPPAPVFIDTAIDKKLAPLIWTPGVVISRHDATLAAEVEGRLLSVSEVGASVVKGDVIANIAEKVYRLKLLEAVANQASATAQLKFLKHEVKRLQVLARQNAAAKNKLEQTESDRDVAASELAVANSRVGNAKNDLDHCAIKAPFDGVITQRLAQRGESVAVGDDVARIVDPAATEVQAHIPVTSVPFVSVGQRIAVKAGSQVVDGKIRVVVPVGDDRSRLFELRLDINGAGWHTGQTVRVAVPTQQEQVVTVVPRDALIMRRDGIAVFRVGADGTAERISVETGIANDTLIQVTGGIVAGDQVIIRGGERLLPGQKVMIQE